MGSRRRQPVGAWVLGTLALCSAMISSCDSIAVTSVAVNSVEVFPNTAELVTGQTLQLSARALDGAGTHIRSAEIVWTATPAELAQVDRSGRVVALGPGVATITATTGGMSGSAAVAIGVPGVLALNRTEVSLTAITAGPSPAPVSVQIDAGDSGKILGLTTDVIYEAGAGGWLTATLSSDRAPAVLNMTAALGTLASGVYAARVDVASSSATNGTQSVRVVFAVIDPLPVIEVSPKTLVLAGTETRSVQVRNVGPGDLTGLTTTIEYPQGGASGWLSVGISDDAAPATLAVGSDDSSLVPGVYTARVWVGSSDADVEPVAIDVQLDGGQQSPMLVVGVGAAQLMAALGGSASVVVNISNGGSGLLDGLKTTVGYAPGQPTGWLKGTLSSSTAPSRLTLVAGTPGLAAGTYTASVEVVGNAPNSPVIVPVTLVVTGQPPQGNLSAPSGLTIVATSSWSVSISWTDNSSNESRFDVRKRGTSGHWQIWRMTGPNVTAVIDGGVGPGTTYDYQVRACNASGCSQWTPVVSVTTP